jgi:hypothetical protein
MGEADPAELTGKTDHRNCETTYDSDNAILAEAMLQE